ncbi:amino acid ABC transporter permease [Homoserinimonas sp. A447]
MIFDPSIFWEQMVSPMYLQGALISIGVAVGGLILALAVGLAMALLKLSTNRGSQAVANVYIWFFRAVPSLLLLLLAWNALPQLIPVFRAEWYSPFVAACLALGLGEAAYMAEALRAALMSVHDGQRLAARALGMTPFQAMRKIILPQAVRIAIPPIGNQFISLIKLSALASVISLAELLRIATVGVQATFRYAEYYAVAIVYYLVIVSLIMVLQSWIEKRFEWRTPTAKRRMFGTDPLLLGPVAEETPPKLQRVRSGLVPHHNGVTP